MASCPSLDVHSAVNTIEKAEIAINEHMVLFFEETNRMGTLQKCLLDLGWKIKTMDVPVINPPKITLNEIFQQFGNHLLSVMNKKTIIPLKF